MNSPKQEPGAGSRGSGHAADGAAAEPIWPNPTALAACAARRERLARRFAGRAVLASGWPRPRNYPNNTYPFRAESHFVYFVGRALEGAALVLEAGAARLYVSPPEEGSWLWHGPEPTQRELEDALGLPVLPLDALEDLRGAAVIPPQDPRAAAWLTRVLGREVPAGSAAAVAGADAALADAVIELRLFHDAAAVDQLRQAVAVSVAAHRAGLRGTRPGLREAQVSATLQAVIGGSGMGLAYEPIVTVHGEVLHAQRKDGRLAAGDLLLCDVGAETPEGWASDVTRTWPVSGRFSPTQRELYDAVLAAQAAALARVRPGVRFTEVHDASQRALLECLVDIGILRGSLDELVACHAVALFYPHGVGHLLGLDVHDMEDLGDRAGYAAGRVRQPTPARRFLRLDRDLAPGMAVTIEPGFYQIPELLQRLDPDAPESRALDRERLARFRDVRGIRIEDDVLVTDTGHELLSAALPRSAAEIEALMRG